MDPQGLLGGRLELLLLLQTTLGTGRLSSIDWLVGILPLVLKYLWGYGTIMR